MRRLIIGLLVLACSVPLQAAPLDDARVPIASYPLQVDGLDATGLNDAMTLTNAPFQNGGVYSNGIYPLLNPAGSLIETPTLAALNFDSFSISVDFKLGEGPDPNQRPVIVGGRFYRWMGFEIWPDGTIGMLHNNDVRTSSSRFVMTGNWHHVLLSYDGAVGSLYMDGDLVCSRTFVIDHGDQRDIANCHFGNSTAYLGHLRNLVVYSRAFDPSPVEGGTWGSVKALFR